MTLEGCTLIEPFQCNKHDSIVEVSKQLRSSTLRQIFVVDKSGKPVGIISTTDINNRIVAEGKDPKGLKAEDIMTSPVDVYDIENDSMEVYKKMKENKRILAPVMEKGKFIGMLTIGEVFQCIAMK